jgi:hypothetical protein
VAHAAGAQREHNHGTLRRQLHHAVHLLWFFGGFLAAKKWSISLDLYLLELLVLTLTL